MFPLFGKGTKAKSSNVTAQRRINVIAEPTVDGDKTDVVFYGRPGLTQLEGAGGGSGSGPALGAIAATYKDTGSVYNPSKGRDYLWTPKLGGWTIWTSPTTQERSTGVAGDATPNTSRVSLAYNGLRLFMVDGENAWMAVPQSAGTVIPQDSANFPWAGATSVTYLAGRFIVNYPTNAGQFCWSPLNASIGATWDGLDYATAESSPDALIAVHAHRGELLLFGTQTLEFWAPSASDVFARISGATTNWGLAAQWSVQTLGESCYFLGTSANGKKQICRLNGYQVEVVSTPDIEAM